MQILLRENVANLGRRGDIVTVKNGYARNFLLPQGIAVAVKAGDLKSIEQEQARLVKAAERERMEVAALAERFVDASVTIVSKANEEGHLFGSVGPKEIAEALTAAVVPVDESAIRLESHIKALGVYDVPIHLSADVEVQAKVYVVGE